MNISNLDNIKNPRSKRKDRTSKSEGADGSKKSESVQSTEANKSDGPDSSVDASGVNELEQLTETAMEAPVEELDLAQLKEDIQNGDYEPDLKGVANRLIGDGTAAEFLTESTE